MDDTTGGPAGARTPRSTAGGASLPQVDVAGLTVAIEATSTEDLGLLARVLGDSAAEVGADADVVIEIGPCPEVPDRSPDFEGPFGDHWDDGTAHHFRHSWGLCMRADAGRIVLGGPASGFERWVTVRNSMLFALARVFFARGRFLLHGAAVARASTALVALGDSGSGKSSLAFAAHRHGWQVLGDDMVVIDPGRVPGSEVVRGIQRVPSVPGDIARQQDVAGDELPHDERRRLELVGFRLSEQEHPVSGVVVCGHGEGSGSVSPLDGASLLIELVPAFVLSALPGPVRAWFPVAVRLSRRPAFRLDHSSDPAERVERAAALLEEIDRSLPAQTP